MATKVDQISVLYVPVDGPVHIKTVERDDLDACQALVGGFIELLQMPNKVDLWMNEEGRLLNLPANPRVNEMLKRATGQDWDIRGNCYLSGCTHYGAMANLTPKQLDYIHSILER